jgi:hypothetical protein
MGEVVRHPVFITTWAVVLLAVVVCGGLLLSTPVGRQALVDERVRVTEALGRRVDDAEYARLQGNPPLSVYLTSGGRLLLTPPVTLLVAAGLAALARLDGIRVPYRTGLAIAVHATVVLALQQIIATPLHYIAESLTSPTNVAGEQPVIDDGPLAARLYGTNHEVAQWWLWLLSVGIGAAAGKPARRYFWRLAVVYVGVAALVAGYFALMQGAAGCC